MVEEENEIEFFLRKKLDESITEEVAIPCEIIEKTIQEIEKLKGKIDELLSRIASIPTEEFDAMIAPIQDVEDDD